MRKEELQALATEAGVDWIEADTKADLVAKIDAAKGSNELLSDPNNLADDSEGDGEQPQPLPGSSENPDGSHTAPGDGKPKTEIDGNQLVQHDGEPGDQIIDSGFRPYDPDLDDALGDDTVVIAADPGVGEILPTDELISRQFAPDDPELYLRHLGLHAEADQLPPYDPGLRSDNITPVDSGT